MSKELLKLPTDSRIYALRDNVNVATLVDNFYYWEDHIYFNYLHNGNRWNVLRINGQLLLASIAYPDRMNTSLKKVFKTTPSTSDNPIITLFYLN